jgi:hypothetical protein
MHTNRWLYACASVISLLIMTMTYQASSGIFVMMSLYFFFRTILYKSDSVKNAFIFLGISCLSYIVALGLFRFCFLEVVSSYVSTDIEVNYNIADLFWKHIVRYFALIYSDWNVIWKITALIIVIIFYVKNIMFSKLHKVAAFFIATLFLTLLACSVFGVYTLLEKPLIEPRAMYSVGVLLAILSVDICFSLKKIFSFPVFILCWCFFVFAFAYGNCLADQKRYDAFRAELLLNDLAHIIIEKPAKSYKFACINSVGFSAVVKNTAQDNPIIKRLIYVTVRNSPFTYISLAQHYKFPLYWDKKLAERKDEIPIVFDSFYHTIKKNDDEIVVILK